MTTLKRRIHLVAPAGGLGFAQRSTAKPKSNVLPVCNWRKRRRWRCPDNFPFRARGTLSCQLQTGNTFARSVAVLLLLIPLWLASLLNIHAATSWNLASEFSAFNPSGVWTYGWKIHPNASWGGSLNQYYQTQFANGVPVVAWLATPDALPAVYANQSGQTGHLVRIPMCPRGLFSFSRDTPARITAQFASPLPPAALTKSMPRSISFITTPITLATRIFTL